MKEFFQTVTHFQTNEPGDTVTATFKSFTKRVRQQDTNKYSSFLLGSSKINKNCTATMTATTANDGHVDVDVCYTHYGHEHELQHIRISKIKRREIALMIREGISRDRVLDEIRESLSDDLHRQHLADKKDLCNISTAY